VLLASVFYGSAVQAGWLGQTVTAEWYVPDNVTVIETHNVVVGAGVELPFGSIVNGPILAIDLSDTEVRFEVSSLAIFSPTAVNGWKFSDTTNSIPDIAGVIVGPLSGGVSGLANSDLSFDANSIFVNLESVTAAGAGDFWTLKVEFVPEPGSLILAALGLVGIGAWSLRRRNR
jgi:hypothetical protein